MQPNQNPDLVVRYWAHSNTELSSAVLGSWGPFGPFPGNYWGYMYDLMSIQSTREGLLVVDLIDTKNKDLAWRLCVAEKIINVDKGWNKADEDFTKGFESYPPSAKQIEDKKKERANEKPKTEQMQ